MRARLFSCLLCWWLQWLQRGNVCRRVDGCIHTHALVHTHSPNLPPTPPNRTHPRTCEYMHTCVCIYLRRSACVRVCVCMRVCMSVSPDGSMRCSLNGLSSASHTGSRPAHRDARPGSEYQRHADEATTVGVEGTLYGNAAREGVAGTDTGDASLGGLYLHSLDWGFGGAGMFERVPDAVKRRLVDLRSLSSSRLCCLHVRVRVHTRSNATTPTYARTSLPPPTPPRHHTHAHTHSLSYSLSLPPSLSRALTLRCVRQRQPDMGKHSAPAARARGRCLPPKLRRRRAQQPDVGASSLPRCSGAVQRVSECGGVRLVQCVGVAARRAASLPDVAGGQAISCT